MAASRVRTVAAHVHATSSESARAQVYAGRGGVIVAW